MTAQTAYDIDNKKSALELDVLAAAEAGAVADVRDHPIQPRDLEREVYGVLGMPVDVLDMETALRMVVAAASRQAPFLISTANLNFLTTSLRDAEFRESLLLSDICSADGVPVVWAARALGVPIRDRIAGSDMFTNLRRTRRSPPLKVFFFGGEPGVASEACKKINASPVGMECVGTYFPGFTPVDGMSTQAVIDAINGSGAEFLAVALGAKKGQAWLLRNHSRLQIPVRSHLGATINFQAGTVRRAPLRFRQLGLEWLWRILEEPKLWRRYWSDGAVLLRLTITRILPLIVLGRWHSFANRNKDPQLSIDHTETDRVIFLSIKGFAVTGNIGKATVCFQKALEANKDVVINFDNTELVDPRFIGLLLMLNKGLKGRGLKLSLPRVPSRIESLFRLNEFGFLLDQ